MNSTFDRRVLTQLRTWLAAVQIPFEDAPGGLLVTDSGGKKVPVNVVTSTSPAVTPGAVVVNGPDLTTRHLDRCYEAFSSLQCSLGYEPKLPVNRGPIPQKKAHYDKDFELVAMRHSEFRRSPDLSPAKMKQYRTVIEKAIWKFYRANPQRCQDCLLDVDDLRSYAQVWTTNFVALYEVKTAKKEEYERFLFQYLRQRFEEFRKLLDKKNRNTLPMLDDAFIAQHGRTYEYSDHGAWYSTDEDVLNAIADDQTSQDLVEDTDPVYSHHARQRAAAEGSRKTAAATLTSSLEALGHDRMVETLVEVVENDRVHQDARREASRRLHAHAISCTQCVAADLPKAHGDDAVSPNSPVVDEDGNVYASVRDAALALKVWPSNVRAVLSGRYQSTGGHKFWYASASAEGQEHAAGADALGVSEGL